LSGRDDQLEAFTRAVNLNLLCPDLNKALVYSDDSKGERSPFDPVLMFKLMVIQTLNNLSDEQNFAV
jgi:IS5 family transposase